MAITQLPPGYKNLKSRAFQGWNSDAATFLKTEIIPLAPYLATAWIDGVGQPNSGMKLYKFLSGMWKIYGNITYIGGLINTPQNVPMIVLPSSFENELSLFQNVRGTPMPIVAVNITPTAVPSFEWNSILQFDLRVLNAQAVDTNAQFMIDFTLLPA